MAGHQEFFINGIKIRYFQEPNVIFLLPTPQASKDKLGLLKNQLETFLSIDSMKTEPTGISLKLSNNSSSNIPEFLRSLGAKGGEEIEDAASIAREPAEQEIKDSEKNTGQPTENPMLSAGYVPKTYMMLYEATFLKAKKPPRRTGKYWKPLEQVTGKNRANLSEKDVLTKRKEYSKKPVSEYRNKILRALDKAFDYFFQKIKETDRSGAESFADKYYALDDLNPKDYSLDKGKAEPIGPEEEGTSAGTDDELNGLDFIDFADILNKNTDSYDDIEIEEPTF